VDSGAEIESWGTDTWLMTTLGDLGCTTEVPLRRVNIFRAFTLSDDRI
jgi:hypothetical protein